MYCRSDSSVPDTTLNETLTSEPLIDRRFGFGSLGLLRRNSSSGRPSATGALAEPASSHAGTGDVDDSPELAGDHGKNTTSTQRVSVSYGWAFPGSEWPHSYVKGANDRGGLWRFHPLEVGFTQNTSLVLVVDNINVSATSTTRPHSAVQSGTRSRQKRFKGNIAENISNARSLNELPVALWLKTLDVAWTRADAVFAPGVCDGSSIDLDPERSGRQSMCPLIDLVDALNASVAALSSMFEDRGQPIAGVRDNIPLYFLRTAHVQVFLSTDTAVLKLTPGVIHDLRCPVVP